MQRNAITIIRLLRSERNKLLWLQQLIRMTCLAVLMVIAGNCGMREVL